MIRPARPLLLLAALAAFILVVHVANADPTPRLLERTESTRRAIPTVSYLIGIERGATQQDAEPAGTWRREERVLTDPTTGEEEVIVLEGPAPDLSERSFLVAIPEGFAAPSAPTPVMVEIIDVESGEVRSDLGPIEAEMRPAQVGLVRAAQVFYRLPETDRAIQARLAVELSAPTTPTTLVRSAQPVPRSLANLFVNGDDAVVMTNATGRRGSTPAILAPPGEIRIGFTAEHRIYRVPLAELGVDVEAVDTIQLLHHGAVIPFDVEGEDIVFYAARRVTESDTDDSVFVKFVESSGSPRLATRAAFEMFEEPMEPTEVELVRTRRFDWDLQYQPAVISLPLGSKFVFHRLRWPGNATIPHFKAHQLPLPDVMTNTFISMRVELHGQNQSNSFNPDHYADISFGGVNLPRTSWEGRTKHTATYNFTLPSLPVGPVGALTFHHQIPGNSPVTAAGNADEQTLDVVEITYLAYARPEGAFGRMRVTPQGARHRVSIGGLPVGTQPDDLLILDVTNPSAPVRILDPIVFADTTEAVAATFMSPSTLSLYQVELLDTLAQSVEVVEAESLPDSLPVGTVLRGIVVRDGSFATALKPWVDHRGPGVLELNPRAAYNAFNGGQASPEAIRDALAHLIESADEAVAVPFALLVGHGSFDRKNSLGLKDAPWIPPFLELGVVFNFDPITMTGTTIENSVDLNFGLLFGDDNLIDVQLARWPAKTPADINKVVARSLAHDAIADKLVRADRPAVFLADNEAAFIQDQPIWSNMWSGNGFDSILMTRGQPVPALDNLTNTAAIRKALDRRDIEGEPLGSSFLFYTGHGNFDRWASNITTSFNTSTNPITNANLATFDTESQWPVTATFTCLNGNYATPGQTVLSMAEAWLFGSEFGATANVAPTGVDYYNEQRLLQGSYINQIGAANPANRAMTIGDMSHRASVHYATQFPSLMKTLREYIVFGDPLALTTVVAQESELAVTLESSTETVEIDEPFVLTLTIENIGIHEARGVVVEVAPPVGYELIEILTPWGEFTDWGELWEVTLGTLIPGQSAVIVLSVTAKPEAISPGLFTAVGRSVSTDNEAPPMDTATVTIAPTPVEIMESMAIY